MHEVALPCHIEAGFLLMQHVRLRERGFDLLHWGQLLAQHSTRAASVPTLSGGPQQVLHHFTRAFVEQQLLLRQVDDPRTQLHTAGTPTRPGPAGSARLGTQSPDRASATASTYFWDVRTVLGASARFPFADSWAADESKQKREASDCCGYLSSGALASLALAP
jgi:hypothetical protein